MAAAGDALGGRGHNGPEVPGGKCGSGYPQARKRCASDDAVYIGVDAHILATFTAMPDGAPVAGDPDDVFDHTGVLEELTSIFVYISLVSAEDVEHEVGWAGEVVVLHGLALHVFAAADRRDQAGSDSCVLIQLHGDVNADVHAGRGEPVVVDAHCEIREGGGFADGHRLSEMEVGIHGPG